MVRMEELRSRTDFSSFPHQNGVEDGVDLEGRKRGDAMKLGSGGESRKKEREEEKERAG